MCDILHFLLNISTLKVISLSHFLVDLGQANGPHFDQLKLRLGVSICLDVVSIETLDLDTEKKSVSTAEKISTVSKS